MINGVINSLLMQGRKNSKEKLQHVIRSAERVTGCQLPSITELHDARARKQAGKIPAHPGNSLFLRKTLEGDRNFFFRVENAGNTDCYLATAASLVDSGTAHEAHTDLRLLRLSDPGLLRKHSGLKPQESEPEASEFDLGTKIRIPKDIMLEELSLMKNRGSKMFKMRQKRVEKFIYENNPDLFSNESMENFQKLSASLGGQMMDVGGHLIGRQAGGQAGWGVPVPPFTIYHLPPPKPGNKGAWAGGAGGAGGGGVDDPTMKKTYVKTYMSPWEKAMKGDESLTATLKSTMPGPYIQEDLPKYKCFNRYAVPFGGFEKANQLLKFQLPDTEVPKEEPEPAVVYQHEIGCRPSFNRTPIGWVGSSEPSSIHMEGDVVPFDVETDDL
ncbi:myozenin-1-like [Polymixia lowei]